MPEIILKLTVTDIEHAKLIERFTQTGVAVLDGLPIPDGAVAAVIENIAEIAATVAVNTVPIAPAPNTTPALDSAGTPWSADFHAATKTKTQAGIWKARKGVDKVAKTAYEAECKAAAARQEPAPIAPVVAPIDGETMAVPAFLNNGVEDEQIPVETVAPTPVAPLAVVPPAPVNTLPPMPAAVVPPVPLVAAVVPPVPLVAAVVPPAPLVAAVVPPAPVVAAIATPADVTLAYQTLATELGNEPALVKVQEIYQRHGVVDPSVMATNESLCATVLQEIKQLIA